jgi:hypothetical protein
MEGEGGIAGYREQYEEMKSAAIGVRNLYEKKRCAEERDGGEAREKEEGRKRKMSREMITALNHLMRAVEWMIMMVCA